MARILHVIESLDARLGGPPAVCVRLAAVQAARGHRVGVLHRAATSEPTFPDHARRGVPGMDRVVSLPVVPGRGFVRHAMAPEIGNFILSQRDAWDFLHVHSVWDPATRAAGAAALRSRIPYVVTTHGMLDTWGMSQGLLRPAKKRIALRLAIGRVLRGAAFLHALTDGEADGIRSFGYGERISVVPNGIFLEEVVEDAAKAERVPLPDAVGEAPFALFLGRLHPVKGIDLLISAFAEVVRRSPGKHLVIAGPDFGEEAALRALAAQLGLGGNVHFIGPVYGSGRFGLMRRCAVFCQLSRYEGFSVALLEALACGCPAVASEQCRFPQIATSGAGIVVDSARPAEVAEAMIAYLGDPDRRVRASASGTALVASEFSWDRVAERMDSAYQSFGIRC
jgi:glycosyltransferase involved in cell wall biosynthesis